MKIDRLSKICYNPPPVEAWDSPTELNHMIWWLGGQAGTFGAGVQTVRITDYLPEKLKTVRRYPIKMKGAGCQADIRLTPAEVEKEG